jgi:hypothetical protein
LGGPQRPTSNAALGEKIKPGGFELTRNRSTIGYHPAMRVLVLVALAAVACSDKTRSGGGGVVPPGPEACAELEDRVEELYRADMAAALAAGEPEVQAKEREILGDNVEMVLVDCRAQPARSVPCIEAAASVAQLERDCLIPLDDEGTVEGKALGSAPGPASSE